MMSNPLEQELAYWNAFIQEQPHQANAYVRRGMVFFKLAQIDASIQDFDRAEQLDHNLTPYLWQRGLSYYYANRFEEGANQFEIDLTVNSRDVEETVWRSLCLAHIHDPTEAQKSLLPVKNDPRRVMRSVYELYAGKLTPEAVLATGAKEGTRGKFYSHLYVGLYYEAAGEVALAREHIAIAAERYPLDDYMWHLACVHQKLRGWSSP